ncbi:MAG: lanthionine synthetase LanC family protein [Bacteroidota bacterium]
MTNELNTTFKPSLLDEAKRIGDQLIALAIVENDTVYWHTIKTINPDGQVQWKASTHLYDGASGIALYLIRLFEQSRETKYLDWAEKGLQWALSRYQQAEPDLGFYFGDVGLAYVLTILDEVKGESTNRATILDIIDQCCKHIEHSQNFDVISGLAGVILGLVAIHERIDATEIENLIHKAAGRLIELAKPSTVGLYWEHAAHPIGGMTGFAHGAAGVGYAFSIIGDYFENQAYKRLAREAFAYENSLYDADLNNWPDFRKGVAEIYDNQTRKERFLQDDKAYFTNGNDKDAWCYGATGIGLSRIGASQLLDDTFSSDAEKALDKVRLNLQAPAEPIHSFTLCHGAGGGFELFLEASALFEKDGYEEVAREVVSNALQQRSELGLYAPGYDDLDYAEDPGLFLGTSGVGYMLLRMHTKGALDSILLIKPKRQSHTQGIDLKEVNNSVTAKKYPRSFRLAQRIQPERVNQFIGSTGAYLHHEKDFVEFLEQAISKEDSNADIPLLMEICKIEHTKQSFDLSIKSRPWISTERMANADYALSKAFSWESDNRLQLIASVEVFKISRDWSQMLVKPDDFALRQNPVEGYFLVLYAGDSMIKEVIISALNYNLLAIFDDSCHISEAYEAVQKSFGGSLSDDQSAQLRGYVLEKVKYYLCEGIIRRVEW